MLTGFVSAPRNRIPGVTRDRYAEHMRDVIMTIFGLSHTLNTKVGNDFIRGVSGGERKRVSIAEAYVLSEYLQKLGHKMSIIQSVTMSGWGQKRYARSPPLETICPNYRNRLNNCSLMAHAFMLICTDSLQ
jgi:hypothetical protein